MLLFHATAIARQRKRERGAAKVHKGWCGMQQSPDKNRMEMYPLPFRARFGTTRHACAYGGRTGGGAASPVAAVCRLRRARRC